MPGYPLKNAFHEINLLLKIYASSAETLIFSLYLIKAWIFGFIIIFETKESIGFINKFMFAWGREEANIYGWVTVLNIYLFVSIVFDKPKSSAS